LPTQHRHASLSKLAKSPLAITSTGQTVPGTRVA
jgi:hypothetical protein